MRWSRDYVDEGKRVSILLYINFAEIKCGNESLRYKKFKESYHWSRWYNKNSSDSRWKTHMTGFEEERYRYNEAAVGRRVIFKTIECRDDWYPVPHLVFKAYGLCFHFLTWQRWTDTLSIYLFLSLSFSLSFSLCLSTIIAVQINYLLAGYFIDNHCVRASEASKSWRVSCGFYLLILKRENGTVHESLETRHENKVMQ